MPFFRDIDLPHDAVLWRRIGTDTNNRPVVSSEAEPVKCLWVARRRSSLDADSDAIRPDASVTILQEVPLGSAMCLGKIEDLPDDPQRPNREVFEVVSVDGNQDIRGGDETWDLDLIRQGDTLPTTGAASG